MPKSLKKIFAVFILIGSLPVVYVAYELSSLNDNEEIINEIYQNQLDAILSSVNQYSTDIVTSWATQLSSISSQNNFSDTKNKLATRVFNQSNALRYVYFSDQKDNIALFNADSSLSDTDIAIALNTVVEGNGKLISKLIQYRNAGYHRMEVLDSTSFEEFVPIMFALDSALSDYTIGIMLLAPSELISNDLGPRMQTIAADQFIISAGRLKDNLLVYATEPLDSLAEVELQRNENWQQRDFWLLPGYYLSITLKGTTIDQVVKERTRNDLIILGFTILVLVGGLVFLFKNIKREIYLSNAKSEFVSNVSHEIRTPLSLISMFAETLEMGRVKNEEKKLEYYGIIKKETFRLTKIVNSILSFSKLDANKRSYHFVEANLNELCKEILQSYSHHLADNNFNYDVNFKEDICKIEGDKEAVSEAIINLVDNAMKYSNDKKEVFIKTGEEADQIFVEVTDFGLGIPKKYQEEIFDQFFRTPSNNVHNTKGSGLGLAIVKRIMMAHNGAVTVESTPGKGSTFRLSFPTIKQT